MPYEYVKISDNETKVLTHCNDCVFAQWDEQKQIGCRLNRLEKFAERGANVENVTVEDMQYKRIDRICLGLRGKEWVEIYKHRDLIDQVKREFALWADVIIPFCEGDNLDYLAKTIESLTGQTKQPCCIHVPNNQKNIRMSAVVKTVRELSGVVPWKTTYIKDVPIAIEKCIDEVYPAVTGSLYIVAPCGYEFPRNFINSIDIHVNQELYAFSLLKSANPKLYVVSSQLHKHPMIEGNIPIVMKNDQEEVKLNTLIEKIEWLAKDQPHMIGDLDKVCGLSQG